MSLFDSHSAIDAARTLSLYQKFYADNGPSLPAGQPSDMRFVDKLHESLDGLEGLILDSYGVIGLGVKPIDGITLLFDVAKEKGIPIVILTNGASQPAENRVAGYQAWGLDVTARDIVSSRDACYQTLLDIKRRQPEAKFSYLGQHLVPFEDVKGPVFGAPHYQEEGWAEADYFIFLGAIGWQNTDQDELESALLSSKAKVIVGYPDVSAPQNEGFSFEPGFWAMRAQEKTGAELVMTGKPYASAYDLAMTALCEKAQKTLSRDKVGMVGDSLHTDILGAKSYGLQAILLSSYGLMAGLNIEQQAALAQIWPDIVARKL